MSSKTNTNDTSDLTPVPPSYPQHLVPDYGGDYDLGSISQRWDAVYAQSLDLSAGATVAGLVRFTNTTNSTSASTGAVIADGGMLVKQNLNVLGDLSTNVITASEITTSTLEAGGVESVSTTTGSIVVSGGVGATGNMNIGGDLTVDGALNATFTPSGVLNISDTTQSLSTTTGAIVTAGGLGVAKNANIEGTVTANGLLTANKADSSGGGETVVSFFCTGGMEATGDVRIATSTSTASTNSQNGALVVVGGVGVNDRLYVGGRVGVEDATQATSMTSASLVTAGGIGVTKSVIVGQDIVVDGDTIVGGNCQVTGGLTGGNLELTGTALIGSVSESTTSFTGALVVAGGVGVNSNLNVGGDVTVGGTLYTSFAPAGVFTVDDTTQSTTTGTGALVAAGGLGVAKNANIGGDVTANGVLTANKAAVLGDDSTLSFTCTGSMVTTGDALIGQNTSTESTDSTTGSLVTAGGAGVGGRLYVGGRVGVEDATQATSTTSASLVTAGGIGVAKKLIAGGSVTVQDTTDSASSSTGSIITAGGVGIAKNVNVDGTCTVAGITRFNNTLDVVDLTTAGVIAAGGLAVTKDMLVGQRLTVTGTTQADGGLTSTSTTNSTSASTGSIFTNGGLGVAKNIFLGASSNILYPFAAGGASIMGEPVTAGTSTSTSAYTYTVANVLGGLFLRNASGTAVSDTLPANSAWSTYFTGLTGFRTSIRFTIYNAGTVAITLNKGTSSNDFYVYDGTNAQSSSISIPANSRVAMIIGITESSGLLVRPYITGITGNVVTTQATITGTTASTSTTTGSLITAGGVGIAGNVFVGGYISSARPSWSAYGLTSVPTVSGQLFTFTTNQFTPVNCTFNLTRMTATVAGNYCVTIGLAKTAISELHLFKNGSRVRRFYTQTTVIDRFDAQAVINMAVNDYLEIVFITGTFVVGAADENTFAGFML